MPSFGSGCYVGPITWAVLLQHLLSLRCLAPVSDLLGCNFPGGLLPSWLVTWAILLQFCSCDLLWTWLTCFSPVLWLKVLQGYFTWTFLFWFSRCYLGRHALAFIVLSKDGQFLLLCGNIKCLKFHLKLNNALLMLWMKSTLVNRSLYCVIQLVNSLPNIRMQYWNTGCPGWTFC